MAFYLPRVRLPHRKNTKDIPATRFDSPAVVTIPMVMHIGKPATPTVKVGDAVKVGTLIGEADGLCSPIYSSVSGKVIKIIDYLLTSGAKTTAVVIESDGQMTEEEHNPPVINNQVDLVTAIKDSGVVGLGGAGFPTYVKFDVDPERIDYLIVNGAECEPYITSDSVTMIERDDDIVYALEVIKKHLNVKHVIFGIENNKKLAIQCIKEEVAEHFANGEVTIKILPSVYPQGGEKVLVYHTTGRKIPAGKLPIDVGCVIINCTTLAAIGNFFKTGMPLTKKCITVDGGCVNHPQNVIAPIGTPINDLFEFCGGLNSDPDKILYGGPMMGITVPNTNVPVLKNTNAVLALTQNETKEPKTTACIRCGTCTNTCPFGLAPAEISRAYNKGDTDALIALNVNSCMECGCCSFVCPANRPLVQTNKLSKQLLREAKAKEARSQ